MSLVFLTIGEGSELMGEPMRSHAAIAVLIPCYNEELTVAQVVESFYDALPQATVYVYDNASDDNTAQFAAQAGAIVVSEPRRGKGNVVRQMFREVNADAYLLVDGDMTYSATDAQRLLVPILSGQADMVVGDRLSSGAYAAENTRAFHGFGNKLVAWLVRRCCGGDVHDVMTGYRAFSRTFVKSFPVLSKGFEIETEMTVHALDRGFRVTSVDVSYRDRPEGSDSKLDTFADGARVLAAFGNLMRHSRPLVFFGTIAVLFAVAALVCGLPPVVEYATTGFVSHVPLCIAAVGAGVLSALSLVCGLILDSLSAASRRIYELEVVRLTPPLPRQATSKVVTSVVD